MLSPYNIGVFRARILFLSANPDSTARLALDEEVREIQVRLRQSGATERIELCAEWALRADELPAALMRHRPQVVHFSGHGSSAGELYLSSGKSGDISPVGAETLRRIFEPLAADISCVVLNACYSAKQAETLAQIVPCVVGMSMAMKDTAAIAFAAGLYEALAFGESVEAAFKLGCAQIELAQEGAQREIPKLLLRPGTDAAQLRPFAAALVGPTAQGASSAPILRQNIKRVGALFLLVAAFATVLFLIGDGLYTRKANSEKAEYRKLLNFRADDVQLALKNTNDTQVLQTFQALHKANLEAIKDDNLILSHELTSRIHRLLARRERAKQKSASSDDGSLAEQDRLKYKRDLDDLDYLLGLDDRTSSRSGRRQQSAARPPAEVLVRKYFELARDLGKKSGTEHLAALADAESETLAQLSIYAQKEELPEQLTMSEIQKTLKSIDASSCKELGASGVFPIKLTIDRSGAVSSTTPPLGERAGVECVVNKVKSAQFGKFSGDPMTLTFPFIIR